MTSSIYQTLFGPFIDLARLVAVDELGFSPDLDGRMGGHSQGFYLRLRFQLMQDPVVLTHLCENPSYNANPGCKLAAETKRAELVEAWKAYQEHAYLDERMLRMATRESPR